MEGVGMIGGWFFQICFGVGNDSWPMKKKHSLLVLEEQSADFHSMAHSTEWIHSIECFLFDPYADMILADGITVLRNDLRR
ncbi:hypothetical protein CASFOL_028084 [Castilleja foliolosa]|uniref:Uncharacterized protein n=1 Tax=Castilleja foliolosa TaxID=1961234 RepID=A0ABD3CEQ0_9LAMI